MKYRTFLLLLLSLVLAIGTQAQSPTRRVVGKVTILKKYPVANIEVHAKKAGSAIHTDSTGAFAIVCNDSDVLTFKSKSFKPKNVKVKKGQTDTIKVNLDFKLTEENLDVAIGYGYIDKKYRTEAVTSIPKGVDYCAFSSVYDVIKSCISGITMSGDCIIVRGPNTVNGNSCALLIVDDVMVESLSFIQPCDIKSISLIKDGTAAIYGARSANGVLLIELRK